MSLFNSAETALLSLLFNATTWANIAINATSSPLTQLAMSLHTADPGEAGNLSTSEAAYSSYARALVNRDASGFTVSGDTVTPTANIDFVTGTGGGETVTHFGTGKTGGGAAQGIVSGTVTPNISTGNGVTPRLSTSTTITAS